jgi:hypothetical protein
MTVRRLTLADGNLEGTLAGTITGGTGRFTNARRNYTFHLVAQPINGRADGFARTAEINGVISSRGSLKK